MTLWFNKDMLRLHPRSFPSLVTLILVLNFTAACTPQAAGTPFRPPTQPLPTQVLATTTPIPAIEFSIPTATVIPTPTTGPCTNNLEFVQDVTIPDGTSLYIGTGIDKQWLVTNTGTCNWDSTYRLKWIGGNPLGAKQDQVLYPARAGTQATLRVSFTAPTIEGPYESAWQAYGPDDIPFGDSIYMKIVVTP